MAVAHFHKLGVVHRDLKPANVLASRDAGRVTLKVADFGIGGFAAKRELEKGAGEHSTGGRLATIARGAYTPAYASPQ
jgi:serine/threonine protein kinase